MKVRTALFIVVLLVIPGILSADGTDLIKVSELKVGRPNGRFALLLLVDASTEFHEVRAYGRYTIYFRNTVLLESGVRYMVNDGGVFNVSLVQTKPDVVAMEVTLDEGYDILNKGYDEKSKGFLFFTEKSQHAVKPRSPLEIEAEKELNDFLKRLRSEGFVFLHHVNRVVIDPGHGGFDSGAIGPTGLKEKDVVLDIAKRVKRILESKTSIRAFLTRRADYYIPLSARTVISNKYRADLFISIHANASKNKSARGFEVYYCSDEASSREAEELAKRENISFEEEGAMSERKGLVNIEKILFMAGQTKLWEDSRKLSKKFFSYPGIHLDIPKNGVHSANFFVLRKARMPSILIEVAYISNPIEERLLRQERFREKLAQEIVNVIRSMEFR